jgi:transcription-repair coupling factor (superfamily II helicase)
MQQLNDKLYSNQYILITEPVASTVKIAGNRYIVPGDYIVHQEYGIGKYLGVKMVDITPNRLDKRLEPTIVVQYMDANIEWFQRVVDKDLWLFRTAESGDQELSSIIDLKKWIRRKKGAVEKGKKFSVFFFVVLLYAMWS